ncbi:MAG: DNA polymerase III subunit delta [Bacteroidales bacterium]|nr:DNA polymerase III subunit delta [Bacteroidales bacterium]
MAAPKYIETDKLCRQLVDEARKGIFRPVYLLMGEEPFYVDMVCNAIMANCISEDQKDFNEIICYGSDVDADKVITEARSFPVFSDRRLVVLKEAQAMKDLEMLATYCENPLESTVLVICMMGAKADKRKGLYKSAAKAGVAVESSALRDYEMSGWITSFYLGKGLRISPDAAGLLAESAGMDLNKVAVETEKMLKNLPEGTVEVSAADIEQNIGVSRQYSAFELSNALLSHDVAKSLRIAHYIGSSARFAMPAAVGPVFAQFYKLLRYEAFLMKNPSASNSDKAALLGVNPFFIKDYDMAARWYPVKKCMGVVAIIKEYDFKGKGGNAGEASPGDLLVEMVTKILA